MSPPNVTPVTTELLSTGGDAHVIVETAQRAAAPSELADDLFSVVVPRTAELRLIDVTEQRAKHQDRPARKSGHVALTTADSLARYVNTHKVDGTELFADWRAGRVVAVVNDHSGPDGAGWGDHRATLTLVRTPEWSKWTELDGKLLSQVAFAEHLEDMAATIKDPEAAEVIEMAQTFHATTSVDFKSQNLLANGQVQLRFEETITARAGQVGDLVIRTGPGSLLLEMPIFDGMDPEAVGARIRYRLREGKPTIGYQLDQSDAVVREAVMRVVADIEQETEITALWGTPRS